MTLSPRYPWASLICERRRSMLGLALLYPWVFIDRYGQRRRGNPLTTHQA